MPREGHDITVDVFRDSSSFLSSKEKVDQELGIKTCPPSSFVLLSRHVEWDMDGWLTKEGVVEEWPSRGR